MSISRWLLVLPVLFLGILTNLGSGTTTTTTTTTTEPTQELKCGWRPDVCKHCGHDPYTIRLYDYLKIAGLDDGPTRTKVMKCAGAQGGVSIPSDKNYTANLNACLQSETQLDAAERDGIIQVVKDSMNNPAFQDTMASWNKCYGRYTPEGGGTKPVVTIMDSASPNVIYPTSGGGTNAKNIERYVLAGLDVVTDTELVYPNWTRHENVRKASPDLIIIHLSAFYDDTKVSDPDKALRNFLDYMKTNTDTKFLVYTRGPKEGADQELLDRWKTIQEELKAPDWSGRLELWEFPEGHAADFQKAKTSVPFKSKVKDMLGL